MTVRFNPAQMIALIMVFALDHPFINAYVIKASLELTAILRSVKTIVVIEASASKFKEKQYASAVKVGLEMTVA